MKILIDADACPVNDIVISIAKENHIPVEMFFDCSHIYQNDYATVHIIGKGHDSVDFFLLQHVEKSDIVVTQDYGLATLVLAKGGKAINQYGLIYDENNIDNLLQTRYISSKIRQSGGRCRGPKKRTKADNKLFSINFAKLITSCAK